MTINPQSIFSQTASDRASTESSSMKMEEAQGSNRSSAPKQQVTSKKPKAKLSLKSPSQERSKITVRSILDACAHLIVQKGFFGITTEMIAKQAGVSIGSLYQFFGNKESVVSALILDLFENDREFISQEMAAVQGFPTEVRMKKFIQTSIERYQEKADLRARVQHLQIYLSDKNFYIEKINFYQNLILEMISDENSSRDQKLVSRVMAQAFVGILNSSIRDTLDLRSPQVKEEIYLLFRNYLKNI